MAFRPLKPQPDFAAGSANIHYVSSCQVGLSLPTVMILSALSALFSARLSRLGGMSACQSIKSDGFSDSYSLGHNCQVFPVPISGRFVLLSKGGRHRRDCASNQIRRAVSSPSQRPKACGCRYYYGKSWLQLICAMHPYGPSDSACQDWVALEANL